MNSTVNTPTHYAPGPRPLAAEVELDCIPELLGESERLRGMLIEAQARLNDPLGVFDERDRDGASVHQQTCSVSRDNSARCSA